VGGGRGGGWEGVFFFFFFFFFTLAIYSILFRFTYHGLTFLLAVSFLSFKSTLEIEILTLAV